MAKRIFTALSGTFALLLLTATQAFTGSSQSSLQFTATIPISCSISTTAVAFGTNFAAGVTTQGAVSVTCPSGTPWHIALNNGSFLDGGSRALSASSNGACACILFELYKDSGLTQIWGDSDFAATYPTGSSLAGTGTGSTQNNTVFAQSKGIFPTGAILTAGIYTDTVTATVLF